MKRHAIVSALLSVASFMQINTVFAEERSTCYDCGTLALHSLLKLEDHPVRVIDLERRMPSLPPCGYSMAQLRDVARAYKLSLFGVRLSLPETPLDRPAIVYLDRGNHGHFLLIRPVGHTGRLVQTIDVTGNPSVIDVSDLVSSRDWTGLALIPTRPRFRMVTIVSVSASLAAVSIVPAMFGASRKWNGKVRLPQSTAHVAATSRDCSTRSST